MLACYQCLESVVSLCQFLLQTVFRGFGVVGREDKRRLSSCLVVQGKPPQPPLEMLLPGHMEQWQGHMIAI